MCSNKTDQTPREQPDPRSGIPCSAPGSRITAWLALLRVPNLLTVPGDPVAGAFLAAAAVGSVPGKNPLLLCPAASLCLYAAGLLANDYFDRQEDARERPDRPLPSGRVPAPAALGVAVLLTAAGLLLAAMAGRSTAATAMVLALAAWGYNAGLKRMRWIGPLTMGLCRAASFLLGAATLGLSALATPTVLLSAIALALFIAFVTNIARNETRAVAIPFRSLAVLPLLLLLWFGAILFAPALNAGTAFRSPPGGFALLLAAMPVVWVTLLLAPLAGQPSPALVQRTIGGLIRGLVLVQAALCAASGRTGEAPALLLLAAFPVSGWLGRWSKGS